MVQVSATAGASGFTFQIPDGWHSGDVGTINWHHAKPHTGWIFLEGISGQGNPAYGVTGPGKGEMCHNNAPDIAHKPADYFGTSGTSQLHMQSDGVVGATYRIKLYLCDNDYGGDAETTFVLAAGSPSANVSRGAFALMGTNAQADAYLRQLLGGAYDPSAFAQRMAQPGESLDLTISFLSGGRWQNFDQLQAAAQAPATAPAPTAPPTTAAPITAGGGPLYQPPNPEPTADDGSKLSGAGADMQSYYVATYGQGIGAATGYVLDHNRELAYGAFSTSTPIGAVPAAGAGLAGLPAGVSGIGSDVGLLGGSGSFSSVSTPSVVNQRQTGAPPPAVGGGLLSSNVGGVPIWLIGLGAAAFLLGGRR